MNAPTTSIVAHAPYGGRDQSLVLPWPSRDLSPNARLHFQAKARAIKAYREGAFWLARSREIAANPIGEILIEIVFHQPDNRRRDLDNMLASLKAGIDGIADALSVNDNRFAFLIRRGEKRAGGEVVVRLSGGEG
jgi:crossover junction endodeoxyribonuclease RusA